MDWLWSPWRYRYVTKALPQEGCVFCAKPATADEEALILLRARHNYVILNLFPYTTGHLMVVPYQHVARLEDTSEETLTEMMLLGRDAERHLRAVYKAEGINMGMNIGSCAGAGVAGHIHLHVLPRWSGDVNFLSTVGETRVIPEDLPETWRKLRAAFSI